MLYYLLYPLRDIFFVFNVFKYITFRAAGAAVTSLVLSLCLCPYITRKLKTLKIGEPIRKGMDHISLYNLHKGKEGTPTMGGILILIAITASTILWADILNKQVLITLGSAVVLGTIGLADDYIKLRGKQRGLSARVKFLAQSALTLGIFLFMVHCPQTKEIAKSIVFPFHKIPVPVSALIYFAFILLVICGSSNAVNLTDGLDGLAAGCILAPAVSYGVLAYITGHIKFAHYLNVLYIPGSGELSIICAAVAGAGLGFLWFNSYPASIFMGDTGAVSLGGIIGIIAVLIKKELLLLIIGGIFVLEAFSVILQVGSFKLRKKRIFAMAPLHHHFEIRGLPEAKITVRFWIIALICALLGLGSLKLQ